MERFENKWSKDIKISTFIGLLAIFMSIFFTRHAGFVSYVISAFIFIVIFICWLFSVKHYYINTDGIIISRPAGDITVRWKDISELTRIDSDYLKGSIRVFGNYGFFGAYGFFKNTKIGNYRGYFADTSNLVLIRTKEGINMVISPYNADFFVEYAKNFLKN